jgi:TonB-dependent SusC/RagA subfamily outer membrane receptor
MNPADIESIEVLKDAASTAIYGSRAANGIILVKTKSGQKGKPVVSLRYTYGVEQQPQRIPLLNARDYITLSRSNIAKFNQADLTYNGKEDQAKFLSGSFGMSTGILEIQRIRLSFWMFISSKVWSQVTSVTCWKTKVADNGRSCYR